MALNGHFSQEDPSDPAVLLVGWNSLTPEGRQSILDHMDILHRLERPGSRAVLSTGKVVAIQREKIDDLKAQMELATGELRKILAASLPANVRGLLADFESLVYFQSAAEIAPSYFYQNMGQALDLAGQVLWAVFRKLTLSSWNKKAD